MHCSICYQQEEVVEVKDSMEKKFLPSRRERREKMVKKLTRGMHCSTLHHNILWSSSIIYYDNHWFGLAHNILWYRKNSSEKKNLDLWRSRESFPADLMIFQEICWEKKRLPNWRNVNFQWILISSGSESDKIFLLDFWMCAEQVQCRFPAERLIRWKCAISSAFPANRTGP